MCKGVIIILLALYVQASDISRQSFGNDSNFQYLQEQNPDKKDDEQKTNINKRHLLSITLPVIGGILILLVFLYYLTRPGGRCCRIFDEELPQPCPETCIGLCNTETTATLNQLTEVPLKTHILLSGDHTDAPLRHNIPSRPLLLATGSSPVPVPLPGRCCCQQDTPESPSPEAYTLEDINGESLKKAKIEPKTKSKLKQASIGSSPVPLPDRCCCQEETAESLLPEAGTSEGSNGVGLKKAKKEPKAKSQSKEARIGSSPVPLPDRCCCQQETPELPSPEACTSEGSKGERLTKAKKELSAKSKLKQARINSRTKTKIRRQKKESNKKS